MQLAIDPILSTTILPLNNPVAWIQSIDFFSDHEGLGQGNAELQLLETTRTPPTQPYQNLKQSPKSSEARTALVHYLIVGSDEQKSISDCQTHRSERVKDIRVLTQALSVIKEQKQVYLDIAGTNCRKNEKKWGLSQIPPVVELNLEVEE